ncbi:MAG: AAA family ATPase [Alphaproteobacteria bacterium]|nr:AAA family ATPase [Alphaproteobacteria bacterium]
MITTLQLCNFRNHENIKFDLSRHNVIVFCGENGVGKTNVLEAISMFSGSSGIHGAKNEDIIRQGSESDFWHINVEIDNTKFVLGYLKSKGKRVYKVNGKQVRNSLDFLRENYILWLTYATDRLFVESPANRREFIDMLCSAVYKEHSANLSLYEKLARERIRILKKYCESGIRHDIANWLDVIEPQIADLGIKVSENRINIAKLLEANKVNDNSFPEFVNNIYGIVEQRLSNLSAEEKKTYYKEELKSRRVKDGYAGKTTFSPNSSDWIVRFKNKNMFAYNCSAGEQKILLCGIFLSFVIYKVQNDKRHLIILLDDVIAHLDENYREILFSYINRFAKSNGHMVTIFLTGIDREQFKPLGDDVLFFGL